MKLTDFNESFKHYKVKHKKTGKEYKVTAMHDKSAKEKARAQHGGTASRYTGTSSDDFEIVEGIFTKHSDDPISGGGQSSPRKPVPVEGQVITLDNERYKVIKVSKDRKTFDVMNIKDPSETHFDIKVDKNPFFIEGKKKQVKANSKKPKLIKPNTGHESPHPYQGKLVGEQKDKMPKQSNPVAKHSRNKSGAGAHKSIKDYDRKKEKQDLKKMNFDEGEFVASKSAVIDSILRKLKDEAQEDDKLLRHLAKLVKKDAKPRFHNKPEGRFTLSPLEEEMKNVWEVRQMMTEEEFDEAAGKKDACYHKVKSRYKVWPSAYASGALVQCRKKGAANWGNSKKKKKK